MAAQDSRDAELGSPNHVSNTSTVSVDLAQKASPDDRLAQFVAEHQDYPPMTPEMEKRIKKKIDAWIIPLVRANTSLILCVCAYTPRSGPPYGNCGRR